MRPPAFTLVEVLLAVAIIVVLLALVATALDRALYRAELTVCATRLHTMASGAVTYATAHARRYPYRPGVQAGDWEPHKLYHNLPGIGTYDERPIIKQFIPLKATLDPLCPEINVDEAVTHPQDMVFRNSHQWAGFRWFGHRGMQRLGDRLTWTDSVHYDPPRTFRFALLASDRDFMNHEGLIVDSSHPDSEGVLVAMKWQSEKVRGGFGLLADAALQATYSGWYRTGEVYRGPSDLNYAFDDGSVQRLDRVLYQDDERMTRVPHFANVVGVPTVGSWPSQFDNLPKP
jgi:prepilin-type N-terminal cleavage/methylation domain-containing protein